MDKLQALYNFWAGFGIPAYEQNAIPSDAQFPYITYEAAVSDFGNDVPLTGNVWYKGTSWVNATQKQAEIGQKIGRGGIMIPYDGGAMWIRKASTFAQPMGDEENDLIKRYVLQVVIEFMD